MRALLAASAITLAMTGATLAQTTTTTPAPGATTTPGTTTTAPATPQRALSADEFMRQSAMGNMFEIETSRLALQKAQSAEVKQFAQQMISDHTQAAELMKSITNQPPPAVQLDQKHQQILQQLQAASGADFDRLYVQAQRDAHQEAVALHRAYAQGGDQEQLKRFAQQILPKLEQHLQHVQNLKS